MRAAFGAVLGRRQRVEQPALEIEPLDVVHSAAARSARLAAITASGALRAIVRASVRRSVHELVGSHSCGTPPAASARAASIGSPVRIICGRRRRADAAEAVCVPPLPGMAAERTSGKRAKRAVVTAILMSQASASSSPPRRQDR
jgi:hypothetical protein